MNHSSRVRNGPAVLLKHMDVPIIKPDDAHKHLLDRDGAMAMAANFHDAIDLVNELVNYGTNLVVRAFASIDRDLKAICVLFVQLRQNS
jgi:hypothetical protein